MKLSVHYLAGNIFTTEIDPTNTVLDLKRLIQSKLRVPIVLQDLSFNNKYLEDEHTLEYYDIKSDSEIYLEKLMFVNVNIPGRGTVPFKIAPCEGIESLKQMIEKKEGIPAFLQQLVFEDKELEDDYGIRFYNIGNYFTIDLRIMIRVNVKISETEDISFGVEPQDTILSAKERIKEMKGVPVSHQKLMLGDVELEDEQTLEHYNIQKDCDVTLQISKGALGDRINIAVKMLTGKKIPLSIDANDSVFYLKKLLHERKGVPPGQQCLVFLGKKLEDEGTLEYYGIKEGDVIHLILRDKKGSDETD